MSSGKRHDTSEDMFAETRMSFGEHIEDLRSHLIRAIFWLFFFVAISFFPFIGKNVLRFISRPVEVALGKYWNKYYREKADSVKKRLQEGDEQLVKLNRPMDVELYIPRQELARFAGAVADARETTPSKKKAREFDLKYSLTPFMKNLELEGWLDEIQESYSEGTILHCQLRNPLEVFGVSKRYEPFIGRQPTLSTLNVQEGFMVYIKVCFMTGLVLACPIVFYQLWSFVAAGLYPHEKRYVNVYLPFSVGLFLIGVILCQFLVIPKAVEALLWFNEWLNLEPDLRLNEWLSFAIFMPLLFGISFQTPLVMLFMERLGIMRIETYRRGRRIAWFIMTVFAAIACPSSDFLSMIFLLVPMCLLYELGIWLCMWTPRRPELEIEVPESGEMVEV
jgi:sec-independent protein translocase protein TatC